MGLIVGILIVLGSTLGGYAAMGGSLAVLWQPFEAVIIVGAAFGAFVIGNTKSVVKAAGSAVGKTFKGSQFKKENYLELISLLYQILKVAKTKGNLGLEQHIENPHDSALFQQFPGVLANETAIVFMCDYLRMMTLGSDDPHEMETLMDEEIEVVHHEHSEVAHALQTMADGMPALGIVAAVLGVIKTMGSITEPPEILGKLIGGALVGTFLGVWISYGFLAPIATKAQSVYNLEIKYLYCIKAALLAHMHGSPPAVSVEFARKALHSHDRPTFYEVEDTVGALPPPA
jgi:chemotaxis protein MotA